MPNPQNLKPFTGANDPRRMNGKPKGTLSLSMHIKKLMNDENFEANILDSKLGILSYKGIPTIAIIKTAIQKALNDKDKGIQYMEWLAKYGYGTSVEVKNEDINVKFEVMNRVPEPKKEN